MLSLLPAVPRRWRKPVCVSVASLHTPRDADAPPLARPGPAPPGPPLGRTGHSTPGPACPQTDGLALPRSGLRRGRRASREWTSKRAPPGGRPRRDPRGPPRQVREPARTPGPAAGAREPAARPRIYIFPSLGAGGSLLHLNEELRASGRSEAGARGVTREHPPQN